MMLRMMSVACTIAAGLSLAGPASAADPLVVRFQQPTPAKAKLIAGGVMFSCQDVVCVAAKPGSRTYAAATCRELAKAFGPVTAFGSPRAEFDGERLAACNAGTPGEAPQLANR